MMNIYYKTRNVFQFRVILFIICFSKIRQKNTLSVFFNFSVVKKPSRRICYRRFYFFKGIFILDEAIRSTHLDIIDATYSNSIRVSSYRYRIIIHEIDLLAKNMK